MDTCINKEQFEIKDTLKQSEGDILIINIKPLCIIDPQNINNSFRSLKNKKRKDFTLFDSTNKSKKFHKDVLEDTGKFNRIQKLLDDESEFKLWFEVEQKVLDSIESLVYHDDDENSLVKFENVFDLFKISVALEDLDLQNKVISYLSLFSYTIIDKFNTPLSQEFLIKVSFDFLIFLMHGKDNNLFADQQLYQNSLTLINDLFQTIFSSLFIIDNFDSFLTIFNKTIIQNDTDKD